MDLPSLVAEISASLSIYLLYAIISSISSIELSPPLPTPGQADHNVNKARLLSLSSPKPQPLRTPSINATMAAFSSWWNQLTKKGREREGDDVKAAVESSLQKKLSFVSFVRRSWLAKAKSKPPGFRVFDTDAMFAKSATFSTVVARGCHASLGSEEERS